MDFQISKKRTKRRNRKGEKERKTNNKPKTKVKENVFGFSKFERQKLQQETKPRRHNMDIQSKNAYIDKNI